MKTLGITVWLHLKTTRQVAISFTPFRWKIKTDDITTSINGDNGANQTYRQIGPITLIVVTPTGE